MSAGREPPGREQRREEVRDQLLIAVERLLADGEGYAELSVDRLVAEAGIGRSTFYKYFSDKGDLLRAWFELIDGGMSGSAAAWLGLDGSAQFDDVRTALAEIVGAYRPHAELMATLFEVARYDAGVAAVVDDAERRGTADLARHIEAGQAVGWIDPDLIAEETAAWLSWLGERGQHVLLRAAPDDTDVERLVTAYAEIVWRTLYAFAPARA